jgi:hypothetical protein
VEPSSERVYLWAQIFSEARVGKRIPRLGEEIEELPLPVALPPPAPVGQKHA